MRIYDSTARYDEDLNSWVRKEEAIVTIGLTDFGQEFIGPITAISDVPQKGQLLAKGAIYGVVESDKATTELTLPIGGEVVAINEQLLAQPTLINEDCYGEGWILQLKQVPAIEWADLQSAEAYAAAIDSFFNK